MPISVRPRSWPEPAPEVAAAVRAVYRRRGAPLPVTVRDRARWREAQPLFKDLCDTDAVRIRTRLGGED